MRLSSVLVLSFSLDLRGQLTEVSARTLEQFKKGQTQPEDAVTCLPLTLACKAWSQAISDCLNDAWSQKRLNMEPPEIPFPCVQSPSSGQYRNTESRGCLTSGFQEPYSEQYPSGTRNRHVSTIVTSQD